MDSRRWTWGKIVALEKEVGVARVWLLQLLKVQKGTGRWNRAIVTSVG